MREVILFIVLEMDTGLQRTLVFIPLQFFQNAINAVASKINKQWTLNDIILKHRKGSQRNKTIKESLIQTN